MRNSFYRTSSFAVAASVLAMLAWSQSSLPKPPVGQKSATAPLMETSAYLLKEIKKLKEQTAELKTKLGAAEARLASIEARNVAQDEKIAKKEDKMNYGPDYAGGGWCTKQVFLTTLDNNKTMIRYIRLK